MQSAEELLKEPAQELRLESLQNESVSPIPKPAEHTLTPAANVELQSYGVQWKSTTQQPQEEEKNRGVTESPARYEDNTISKVENKRSAPTNPPLEWAKIVANPGQADSSKAMIAVLFLLAVEISLYIILVATVATLGDETEIEYPAHIVFCLFYLLKCAMAFFFASIVRREFTSERVPMTNEGLQGALGANTLILLLFAGTWPYFAFCFARIHAPSKPGAAYCFYGLFALIVVLHFLVLLTEIIFTYRVKLSNNGSRPGLEKMRLLQKLSYCTNWAPLYLELHRFSAYLAETPI